MDNSEKLRACLIECLRPPLPDDTTEKLLEDLARFKRKYYLLSVYQGPDTDDCVSAYIDLQRTRVALAARIEQALEIEYE